MGAWLAPLLNKYLLNEEAILCFGNPGFSITAVLLFNREVGGLTQKGLKFYKFIEKVDPEHFVNADINYRKTKDLLINLFNEIA